MKVEKAVIINLNMCGFMIFQSYWNVGSLSNIMVEIAIIKIKKSKFEINLFY